MAGEDRPDKPDDHQPDPTGDTGASGPAPGEPTAAAGSTPPAPAGPAASRRGLRGWYHGKGPVFRFVFVFAVLMSSFAMFFFAYFTRTATFDAYLHLNAQASAAVLRWLNEDATARGFSVSSPLTSLQIRHGCDAIFPSALFVGAVLASPVSLRSKLPGLLIGTVVLLSLNLVRIITLYYTRVHIPDWFHMMHVDIWQPAFIFLALFFWILWAVWATRSHQTPGSERPQAPGSERAT